MDHSCVGFNTTPNTSHAVMNLGYSLSAFARQLCLVMAVIVLASEPRVAAEDRDQDSRVFFET